MFGIRSSFILTSLRVQPIPHIYIIFFTVSYQFELIFVPFYVHFHYIGNAFICIAAYTRVSKNN